jgi:hypothetical protein
MHNLIKLCEKKEKKKDAQKIAPKKKIIKKYATNYIFLESPEKIELVNMLKKSILTVF